MKIVYCRCKRCYLSRIWYYTTRNSRHLNIFSRDSKNTINNLRAKIYSWLDAYSNFLSFNHNTITVSIAKRILWNGTWAKPIQIIMTAHRRNGSTVRQWDGEQRGSKQRNIFKICIIWIEYGARVYPILIIVYFY